MAHPKHRISKSRKGKRRTHHKLALPTLTVCSETGEIHQRHRAYWADNKLYYRGRVVMEKAIKEVAGDESGEDSSN